MHNILVCDDDRDIVAALKIYLSGWSYSPKASALPTALIPDFWLLSFAPDVVKHVVRRFF